MIFGDGRDLVGCPTTWSRRRCPVRMTCVYRYYDSAGTLLYVGIAEWPDKRLDEHIRHSPPWIDHADSRTDAWFTSRVKAADAERVAIRTEAPVFNKSGVARAEQASRVRAYYTGA